MTFSIYLYYLHQKGTKWNNPVLLDCVIFAVELKNQLTMIQLSKKMLTFVPSVETDWQHRGELLSFDPSENLQNSSE